MPSATRRRVYHIGPESNVYHVRRDCPALCNPTRYSPLHETRGKAAAVIVSHRRPCKRCSP